MTTWQSGEDIPSHSFVSNNCNYSLNTKNEVEKIFQSIVYRNRAWQMCRWQLIRGLFLFCSRRVIDSKWQIMLLQDRDKAVSDLNDCHVNLLFLLITSRLLILPWTQTELSLLDHPNPLLDQQFSSFSVRFCIKCETRLKENMVDCSCFIRKQRCFRTPSLVLCCTVARSIEHVFWLCSAFVST